MLKLDNKIEIRCPYCDAVQKVPCEKYEVECKKCKETINVEESLENFLRGGKSRVAVLDDGLTLEEMLTTCKRCMDEENYGPALEFAQKATLKDPESEEAIWLLCRAKICGVAAPEELTDYVDPKKRDEAIRTYAENNNLTIKMAENELERKARALACYTDEESDELAQRAIELANRHGNGVFADSVERAYRLYGYQEIRIEETESAEPKLNIMKEIMPNFARRRRVIELRVVGVFLFGLLAAAGGVALILTGYSNGWTIAMVVIGVLLGLVGCVAFLMDGKRREVYRFIRSGVPDSIDQVIAFTSGALPQDPVALQEARYTTLVTVYDLIRRAQLVCVGVKDGQKIVYYNSDGSERDPEPGVEGEEKTL